MASFFFLLDVEGGEGDVDDGEVEETRDVMLMEFNSGGGVSSSSFVFVLLLQAGILLLLL